MKFSIGDLLVLVEVGDRRIQLARLRSRLLRQLLGLTGLGRRLQSLLIGWVRSALCLVDTCLCPAIDVLDSFAFLAVS